jgi:hypothetical protein
MGCIYISPSTGSINSAIDYAKKFATKQEAVVITNPIIVFDDTNIGITIHKAAIIKNFSNMALDYRWKFYHPRTQLIHWNGNMELSSLMDDTTGNFCIDNNHGTLLPTEGKTFVFSFTPTQEGKCRSMCYLELINIPEGSLVTQEEGISWMNLGGLTNSHDITAAVLCIDLTGTTQVLIFMYCLTMCGHN